jgi:ATP-dependent Lhr-like helicase
MLETLKEKAELFLVYKRRAAIALAAHGVGPTTAKRVLSRWHKDEDSFIRSLLEAERQFMKTKKFWAAK